MDKDQISHDIAMNYATEQFKLSSKNKSPIAKTFNSGINDFFDFYKMARAVLVNRIDELDHIEE